ncbi:MAG TPA: hypothetical protein VM778_06065 [Gemmatimonadota bacterium]|nr:hypothetical protein [Gemmatimonadota bacterium]
MPAPVRVTLKWIQITDNLEPGRDKEGEFVFRIRVETDGGEIVETRLPEEGSWFISQKPGKNRVKLDEVVFEGEAGSRLVVELTGEEQDRLTGSDSLETYRREFAGEPSSWVGLHGPGDEGDEDPENLSNWRIGYEIELI